ncbi:TetR/AcrR family transcriptional regulator [Carnimonas bestiolae]|uniref:TetR/AcrR family transcriptional regulator n=1 Tax=Carnimonas bestiolae TaxID=3402172 RepID=UPI003EDBFC03
MASIPVTEQAPGARDRLLAAAASLFYRNGINATGIDAIIREAGVARKSLYNHFSSKSDLVAGYIEERHRQWLVFYRAREAETRSPAEAVLAVFDAYLDHAESRFSNGFRGCGLLNAAGEFAAGDAVRDAVRQYKEEVEQIIEGHLRALLPSSHCQANDVARQIAFLLEGAMMRAGLAGNAALVNEARRYAQQWLEAL